MVKRGDIQPGVTPGFSQQDADNHRVVKNEIGDGIDKAAAAMLPGCAKSARDTDGTRADA